MLRSPAYSGAYNGTAPKPVTMAQLCSSVGGVLGRPRLVRPRRRLSLLAGVLLRSSLPCGLGL